MILPISYIANWGLIHQRKQAQIDKDVILENSTRVYYKYRTGDSVMVRGEITLSMKDHLKFRMTLFKPGQIEMLPFKLEWS